MRVATILVAVFAAGCAHPASARRAELGVARCQRYDEAPDPRGLVETEATMHPTERQQAESRLRVLHGTVARYVQERGRLPDSLAALLELGPPADVPAEVLRPQAWWLTDPWGQRVVFVRAPEGYMLRSAGPDQRLGTADDFATVGPCSGHGNAIRLSP